MTRCWKGRWFMSADTLEMMFREFCLPTMAARFAEMMQSAEAQNWGYRKLLLQLCEAEAADRRERKQERLLRESGLPWGKTCLLYTSPSPRDRTRSRMPSSA